MSAVKGPAICQIRGDTAPQTIIFKRAGVVVDLSGFINFVLTVDSLEAPPELVDPSSTEVLKLEGAFTTDGTDGSIDFRPEGMTEGDKRTASEAFALGEFFYDVQADDAAGARATLLLGGGFEVIQDINKA